MDVEVLHMPDILAVDMNDIMEKLEPAYEVP
jgi:hypothetical protein